MLHEQPNRIPSQLAAQALMFAALGDETRLAIVTKLSVGKPYSISQLTYGTPMTRQAITKHLRVLEDARLIQGTRSGRNRLFEINPEPLGEMKQYLDKISKQWDDALLRLKAFVEE